MRFNRIPVVILTIGSLLFFSSADAQQILGLVVELNEKGVEEPIPGANIFWLGTSTRTTSGDNGVFLIERVSGIGRHFHHPEPTYCCH